MKTTKNLYKIIEEIVTEKFKQQPITTITGIPRTIERPDLKRQEIRTYFVNNFIVDGLNLSAENNNIYVSNGVYCIAGQKITTNGAFRQFLELGNNNEVYFIYLDRQQQIILRTEFIIDYNSILIGKIINRTDAKFLSSNYESRITEKDAYLVSIKNSEDFFNEKKIADEQQKFIPTNAIYGKLVLGSIKDGSMMTEQEYNKKGKIVITNPQGTIVIDYKGIHIFDKNNQGLLDFSDKNYLDLSFLRIYADKIVSDCYNEQNPYGTEIQKNKVISEDFEVRQASGGYILKDRATGVKYRIYVENGALKLEEA